MSSAAAVAVTPPGPPTVAEAWLEDFWWHRDTLRAAVRWEASDATNIFTHFTNGQWSFNTVADLTTLEQARMAIAGYSNEIGMALGEKVTWCLENEFRDMAIPWDHKERVLLHAVGGQGSTEGCDYLDVFARVLQIRRRELEYRMLVAEDVPNVRTINSAVKTVYKQPIAYNNPVTIAWELKQMRALYQAAGNLAEDAICDLLVELIDSRPLAVLQNALNDTYTDLRYRIDTVLDARGKPGDKRRIPDQGLGISPFAVAR